ncbi:MAG: hypothetical protein H8M99_10910 [Gloeobacteraceae cyanobacterium ES-bin-144]|nr:hypothetical protein [Verrucomicrobiales bacterium]
MPKPDPIETILARMMPPALSEQGTREIEAMLDELAGPSVSVSVAKPVDESLRRWLIGGGIAAALVAAAVISSSLSTPSSSSVAAHVASSESSDGFDLVSESDRIESMTDEGWQEDSDGAAVRSMRLNVIEENSVRDEESGMEVQISEPREEVILVPVSDF